MFILAACPGDCDVCNATSCTSCSLGYNDAGTGCAPWASLIDHCDKDDGLVCTLCSSGYYLDATTQQCEG